MFMVLLGGTTTGKTFHFGPDGVLLRSLREALGAEGVRGLRPALSVEVSPVPGGRGSTVSVDFYGAEIDIYPRREYLGWIDMPGQDYLVACPVYRKMAEQGAEPPGNPGLLLEQLMKPATPVELVEEVTKIITQSFSKGLLSIEALAMGYYGMYTDIAPGSTAIVSRLENHLQTLQRALRERNIMDSSNNAWALMNAAIFHLIHHLSSDVRRDLERRRIGSTRFLKALRLESKVAATLARAFLERAVHGSAEDLYPGSIPQDTSKIKACVGPGCPGESWPHKQIAGTVDERIYSTATAMLLEHQALIAGPLAGLLQVELAKRSGFHALTHPVDTSYPAARYLERNISMRSGPENLGKIKEALRRALENKCRDQDMNKALDTVKRAAIGSVSPVRVIQSLALEECPGQPVGDPVSILAELAGLPKAECPREKAEMVLEELSKHYTYTGPLMDLLVSHSRSISYIWSLARQRLDAVLIVITFTDLAVRRTGKPIGKIVDLIYNNLTLRAPLEELQPFPLEPPPGGFRGKIAIVPGGGYRCCETGPCNPALAVGYLSSLMAVLSE